MGLEEILSINEYVANGSEGSVLNLFPSELASGIGSLITILKITGIVIIGYIVFLIIRWIFGIKRYRRINKIYKKVEEIDRKLDLIIPKKKLEKIEKNPEIKKKERLIDRLFKKKSAKFEKGKKV